jgi:hypothetical protein
MITFNGQSFKNPELLDSTSSDFKQNVRRAYSGNIYSFRLREHRTIKLVFKDMLVTDAVLLKNIFATVDQVLYVDYNGAGHSVKCIDDVFEKTLGGGNLCGEWVSFELNLEEIPGD